MEEKKSVVKTTKIYRMMAAVLIVAMSVGLAWSCKEDKEPEPDYTNWKLHGTWTRLDMFYGGNYDRGCTITFDIGKESYSFTFDNKTIDGMIKIKEKETTTYSWIFVNYENVEITHTSEATLFKILVSGSNEFDQLWVYHFSTIFPGPVIAVHLYYGNERLRIFENFLK